VEANHSAILTELLKARGLSVTNTDDGSLTVRNPLHPHVREAVGAVNGSYLMDYGYEIGEQGDEPATADRVAFLLGLPGAASPRRGNHSTEATTRQTTSPPNQAAPGSPVITPRTQAPDRGGEDHKVTPRHAAPPEDHKQALSAAAQLVDLLATRHSIPANVQTLPCGVVVRLFAGLIAYVDHVIWWAVPDVTGTRQRPLRTYATTAAGAADRLAEPYHELRSVPLAELLLDGRIVLLNETEVRRAAAL
jgi:hypothetical protein